MWRKQQSDNDNISELNYGIISSDQDLKPFKSFSLIFAHDWLQQTFYTSIEQKPP